MQAIGESRVSVELAARPGAEAYLLAVGTLCQRELVRFFRQRNRVIGALVQPLIFWLLLGGGFRDSFRPASFPSTTTYAEYFFPGTLVLVLLFTAIFSSMSLIEDRREGFLQSVLVAPLPRSGMVLGKVLGGTVLAAMQAVVFLVLAFTVGIKPGVAGALAVVAFLLAVAFGLTALGFAIAWKMDSTQGFHAIMSVVLMPMWLLSGAAFPAAGVPGWLWWVMKVNPLTYGVGGVRRLLYLGSSTELGGAEVPSLVTCLAVTAAFGVATFGAALWLAGQTTRGDLQ